jgi:hypothetical protein
LKLIFKRTFLILLISIFFAFYYVSTPKIILPSSFKSAEVYLSDGSYGKIITTTSANGIYNFKKRGEAYTFSKQLDINTLLDYYSATTIFTESGEWGQSVFAYSKNIKYRKEINGKTINVHIHKNAKTGEIKIGFPIIYGSF